MRDRLIVILCLLLSIGKTSAQPYSEVEQIKDFYERYMEAIEKNNHGQKNMIINDFLTPEMKKKMERLTLVTDFDPLLRAQDVSDYGRHSLQCKSLGDEWFMVSYFWAENDSIGTHIPVRVEHDGKGRIYIKYVTPYWGNNAHGDNMFDIPVIVIDDKTTGLNFVESFFKAYVFPYVNMSSTLEQDLDKIRKDYCTPSMQERFAIMQQDLLEGEKSIDPLIGSQDFDALWYSSLKVQKLKKKVFMVSYTTGVKGEDMHIIVTIKKHKGKYRISNIHTRF